jgi:two-component system sensor histidine kinase UhpB
MKTAARNIILFFILFYSSAAHTQTEWIDSVRKLLPTQKEDTNRVWMLDGMSDYYAFNDPDSGIICAKKALALAEKLQFEKGIFWSIVSLNHSLYNTGNYALELDYALKAFQLAKKLNDQSATGRSNGMLCDSYINLGDYKAAMPYMRLVMKSIEQYAPYDLYSGYAVIVPMYVALHKNDSALICAKKSLELLKTNPTLYKGSNLESKYAKGQVYLYLGEAFEANANYDSALFYYRLSIPINDDINTKIYKIDASNGMAKVYKEKDNSDSAIWYAKSVLADKLSNSYPAGKLKATNLLADIYESANNTDSSLKYLRIAVNLKDSIYNRERTTAFQNALLKDQVKQKEIQVATTALQNRYRLYLLITLFIIVLISAGLVIRNRRIKQLQKIRNSIADDLHDDIGSALSSINIMSELAKAKSSDVSPLLASIGESTTIIQENMSDIVWTIKSTNDHFENVTQRMNQFASEILDAKNIELDFKSDASLSTSRLRMEQRKNFYLFFKEVINNAAKYSDAKKISVCIAQKDHYVEMNIRDDGKGFDTNKIFSGNGTNTLKKRAAELNGYFKITSQINEGTSVQLKFKIT